MCVTRWSQAVLFLVILSADFLPVMSFQKKRKHRDKFKTKGTKTTWGQSKNETSNRTKKGFSVFVFRPRVGPKPRRKKGLQEAATCVGQTASSQIDLFRLDLFRPAKVLTHLQKILAEHRILLGRIPLLSDLQSAWALLLHCASGPIIK